MSDHLSHITTKPVFGYTFGFDTNLVVQPQKMARGLELWIWEVEGLYYLWSENKGAAQLICTFVFAYAKNRFSHEVASVELMSLNIYTNSLLLKVNASGLRIQRSGVQAPLGSNRVVSLSKADLLPKSTGNTQEAVALSQHDWKIVYRDVKNQSTNQPTNQLLFSKANSYLITIWKYQFQLLIERLIWNWMIPKEML